MRLEMFDFFFKFFSFFGKYLSARLEPWPVRKCDSLHSRLVSGEWYFPLPFYRLKAMRRNARRVPAAVHKPVEKLPNAPFDVFHIYSPP